MPAPDRNITRFDQTLLDATYEHSPPWAPPWTDQSFGTPIGVPTLGKQDYLVTTSVSTPGFATLAGYKLPINNYSKYQSYYFSPSHQTWAQRTNSPSTYTKGLEVYHCNGAWIGIDVGEATWVNYAKVDDVTQRVTSKLIESIKLGKMQASVSLAEAGKTAAMVQQSAVTIVRAIRALRSCRFGDFVNALGLTASRRKRDTYYTGVRKNFGVAGEGFRFDSRVKVPREHQEQKFREFMANTWLQYSYGWKPLLNDVYGAAEAFAHYFTESSGEWRHARERAKSVNSAKASYYSGTARYSYEIEKRHAVQMGVTYKIPEGVVSPSDTFGLNNPLLVAWEVVPFSFVADWFIPIGKALESLTAYDGLVFSKGYVSKKRMYLNYGTATKGNDVISGGVTYSAEGNNITAYLSVFHLTREKLVSFPQFGLPQFKDPRSFAHAVSAIALLQSLFLSSGSRQVKLR